MQFQEHKGYARSATVVSLGMSFTLSLSVRVCSVFVTNILICLGNMRGLCYSSYGRLICMGLRVLLQIVWMYIILLTPRGVRHLISPRWLEEM